MYYISDYHKIIKLAMDKNGFILRHKLIWNMKNQLEWYCIHDIPHKVFDPVADDTWHTVCCFCCSKLKPVSQKELDND